MTSFLYSYRVLNNLGILDTLLKEAQNTELQAIEIAKKMAQKLLVSETIKDIDAKNTPIYVQDLTDLNSFLNYLYKNKKRADDNALLVLQSKGIGGQQPQEELKSNYILYNDFWIHKEGLLHYLSLLEIEANKPNNEIMKTLLSHLIKEIKDKLQLSYESVLNISKELPENSTEEAKNKGRYPHLGLKYSPNDENIQNVNVNVENEEVNQDIVNLHNTLPFQSNNALSPYDMHAFINAIAQIFLKAPSLGDARLGNEFEVQFKNNMNTNINNWNSYLNKLASQYPNLNILSYMNSVPYNIYSGRPNSSLEQIFGSKMTAQSAVNLLLQMVHLCEQALQTIQNNSPQLVKLLGKDIITNQMKQARAFIEKLSSFG